MRALSSWRVFVVATLVAVLVFAWTSSRGAPSALVKVTALGTSELATRGGVVLDVRLPDGLDASAREAAIASVRARLEATGADVTFEWRDARQARVTAVGAPTDRADAIGAMLMRSGRFEMREVLERGALVDRLHEVASRLDPARSPVDRRASGVRRDVDVWTPESGTATYSAEFLYAHDRRALERAVASIGTDPDAEIVIEWVRPGPGARDPRPYWRTYVVARAAPITSSSLARASATWDELANKPIVQIAFTPDGTRAFADLTTTHVGHKIAILIDGDVDMAPIVSGPIRGGDAIVTMRGSDQDRMEDEAETLAAVLRAHVDQPVAIEARVTDAVAKSGVRDALARGLAALLAALAVVVLAWPLVRWPALRAAPASMGRATGTARWGEVAVRLAVTLGVLAALYALQGVIAPGLESDDLALAVGRSRGGVAGFSIVALGATPVVLAYLAIELAALVVPRWRARRHAGRDARAPLAHATIALAVALSIVVAWVQTGLLTRLLPDLALSSARWEVTFAMSTGVALFVVAALVIDRFGLGRGWSAILAFDVLTRILATADRTSAPVWIAGAGVALIAVGATRARVVGPRGGVRLPVAGFVGAIALPIVLAWGLQLSFVRSLWPIFDALATIERARLAAVAIAVVLAAGLGALWTRALGGATRAWTITLGAALAGAMVALEDTLGPTAAVGLAGAVVIAALLDVAVEARARLRGTWRPIAEVHDVDAADLLLAGTAGTARVARGIHVRSLFRFFAPMVPVEILEAQSPEAEAAQAALPPARAIAAPDAP